MNPDDILIRIDVSTGFSRPTRYECRVNRDVVSDAVDSVPTKDPMIAALRVGGQAAHRAQQDNVRRRREMVVRVLGAALGSGAAEAFYAFAKEMIPDDAH